MCNSIFRCTLCALQRQKRSFSKVIFYKYKYFTTLQKFKKLQKFQINTKVVLDYFENLFWDDILNYNK